MPRSAIVHRAYNLCLGLLLLLFALPMMTFLTILLFVTQGSTVFYRGARVGLNGKPFKIIKFRTLDGAGAKRLTQDRVLPENSGVETPLGAFLRDTRLDELPQIVNIILGDMNICGPRPVRPEMVEIQRAQITDYDIRFRVKPGLIGPTQAYMHHGSAKALRARYNRILCNAPVRYGAEIGMAATITACILSRTGAKLVKAVERRIWPRNFDQRKDMKMARIFDLSFIDSLGHRHEAECVNKSTVTFSDDFNVGQGAEGKLLINLPGGSKRYAHVVLQQSELSGVYDYRAASDFSHHIISRYLWQSVVVPHRSHRALPKLGRRPRISLMRTRPIVFPLGERQDERRSG